RGLGRPKLGIAVAPVRPDAAEDARELLVGGAEPERGAQIVAFQREEAGVEAPLGGEPGPRAAAAKRLRDRGDDPDLAGAVAIAPAAGGLVGAVGRDRL